MFHSTSKTALTLKDLFPSRGFFLVFSLVCFLVFLSMPFAWAKPVTLRAQNELLADVLHKIQAESGIRFKLSSSLEGERISGKVQGQNWPEAVKQFLEGYSLVEIRDDRGKLTEVFLLGKNTEGGFKESEKVAGSIRKLPMSKEEMLLSKNQLRELAKGPFRSPIPAHFSHDAGYREFFAWYETQSPGDLNDVLHAMRIRVEARRQLKILQK
ncbi:MAG: hypothetical protein ACE5EK_09670 [Nitrospinales bacterium]